MLKSDADQLKKAQITPLQPPEFYQTLYQILLVTALISLRWLLDDNVGRTNEVDVLPLALQHTDPSWIPGDWYLNQPSGYRLLFEAFAGRLILAWGFLAASIVGRLVCYTLVAAGLVLIGQALRLRLPLLLLTVALFVLHNEQGAMASEWIVRGFEAKAIAYGLVLLGIWAMLKHRYRMMAILLGVATSFHVLVGGWSFLIAAAYLLLHYRSHLKSFSNLAWFIGIYLAFSVFAIPPVITQLFGDSPAYAVSPSSIYVFLRLQHHLNPLSGSFNWYRFAAYLILLVCSIRFLQRRSAQLGSTNPAQTELFQFTLISLVPCLLGLLVAPFDTEGRLLQFYPFRVGAVLLPLSAYLLAACALQSWALKTRWQKLLLPVSLGLLAVLVTIQAVQFQAQLLALEQFPNLDPRLKEFYSWVRTQTPSTATIISPPVEFAEFTRLTERPIIANYKLLPQTKTGILGWYERLGDLNGGEFPMPERLRTKDNRRWIRETLTQNYYKLKTSQVKTLMRKYQADYFMTRTTHQLKLSVAYRNSEYILYVRQKAQTNSSIEDSSTSQSFPVPNNRTAAAPRCSAKVSAPQTIKITPTTISNPQSKIMAAPECNICYVRALHDFCLNTAAVTILLC